eukprot:SM000018S03587  [mRNA]  locus=s18:94827:100135:- [translate_table: standard]
MPAAAAAAATSASTTGTGSGAEAREAPAAGGGPRGAAVLGSTSSRGQSPASGARAAGSTDKAPLRSYDGRRRAQGVSDSWRSRHDNEASLDTAVLQQRTLQPQSLLDGVSSAGRLLNRHGGAHAPLPRAPNGNNDEDDSWALAEEAAEERSPSHAYLSDSHLDCQHFGRCSGCSLERRLDQPPILAEARAFFQQHGVSDFKLNTGDVWGWRCRAKLAVRGTAESPEIGLFEEDSHVAVDIPGCRAHHPSINAAVELIRDTITDLRIQPYSEETGLGSLRYIQLVLSTYNTAIPLAERYAQGKVQVSLVWNARDEKAPEAETLLPAAEALWRAGGPRSRRPLLHSVWANFQTSKSNVILGGRWRHLKGATEFWEQVGGADVCFTPGSFGQANYQAFEALLRRLQRSVPRESSVTELYAGVGAIGLSLAVSRTCRRVRCVEVNKLAQAPFELSLGRLPPSTSIDVSWHCADVAVAPMKWLEGAEVVVVDPPRKGLDAAVVDALRLAAIRGLGKAKIPSPLAKEKVEKRPWMIRADRSRVAAGASDDHEWGDIWPSTLIYVSCGFQAFRRDCELLTAGGAWHLDNARAFHFFPGTDSMEILAVFKSGKRLKQSKLAKNVGSKKLRKEGTSGTRRVGQRPRDSMLVAARPL